MEPKTIIAIVLVAFIIGGFIFLQVKNRKKKYAGGACKGSDCKRSNDFAGSGCCLIDFTHSYALWRFFKKYLKTT